MGDLKEEGAANIEIKDQPCTQSGFVLLDLGNLPARGATSGVVRFRKRPL